ncbi:HAUS6 protein, partial [Halcyon senegalensis]|nr:HAUS6 protein [Halcyon senegalensis]
KVHSLWTVVTEILTSLEKEKENVDSVLEDGHDQCILDGTNVFRIPQLLIDRVGSDVHQLCTGNLYEDEKLNFLTVIQLLNEALRTLRDEHCISELKQLPVFENRIKVCKEVLEDLTAKRLEIEQQHCMSTNGSICRKQENWELKWKSFLDLCPFNLLLDQNPVSSVQSV